MNCSEDHREFAGGTCPECKEPVDDYGNTAYSFLYCSFPDCGCDGARLCMASSGASDHSCRGNVEGMWSLKTKAQREAVAALMVHCHREKNGA